MVNFRIFALPVVASALALCVSARPVPARENGLLTALAGPISTVVQIPALLARADDTDLGTADDTDLAAIDNDDTTTAGNEDETDNDIPDALLATIPSDVVEQFLAARAVATPHVIRPVIATKKPTSARKPAATHKPATTTTPHVVKSGFDSHLREAQNSLNRASKALAALMGDIRAARHARASAGKMPATTKIRPVATRTGTGATHHAATKTPHHHAGVTKTKAVHRATGTAKVTHHTPTATAAATAAARRTSAVVN
ncbi:hypothetical protein BDZ88DRAFT_475404 [Geranomyces variabilis]|nr:hypothetical protein BDZ88DRAFT_475404 [Geranomyces variabilis]KAJ3138115.1 hypothetical protein HDU90_001594 [Geranomyces variabilis]